MTNKGDALALAIALSSSEETLLGPSDSQICAIALRHYARETNRSRLLCLARLPVLVGAVLMGACALTYETPMILTAKGASPKTAIAFGYTDPIPHLWLDAAATAKSNGLIFDKLPRSIEAHALAATFNPDAGD